MSLPNLAHTPGTRRSHAAGGVPGHRARPTIEQAELFLDTTAGTHNADGHFTGQHPAAHALKVLLMDALLDDHPAQRLMRITTKVPQACLQAWHLVAHTLLARRLDAAGPQTPHGHSGRNNAHTVAWALQRQWEQPLLAQRWQRLLAQMSAAQCERLVQQVRRIQGAH